MAQRPLAVTYVHYNAQHPLAVTYVHYNAQRPLAVTYDITAMLAVRCSLGKCPYTGTRTFPGPWTQCTAHPRICSTSGGWGSASTRGAIRLPPPKSTWLRPYEGRSCSIGEACCGTTRIGGCEKVTCARGAAGDIDLGGLW